MAEGSKIPTLPSISPRTPAKEMLNLRQTVDIMLKQIHANQEAIRTRDNEIVAMRMELSDAKKVTADRMMRMSNNIKMLKQQINELRQRESDMGGVETELKNFTSKQDELIRFQEKQDSKLGEMECSIIESCHRAIADIRTKQLKETEETTQSQIQSWTKLTSVQGILRSNVQSVQTLLEKKTMEDNRKFQKQEALNQTLQSKMDQVLVLENSIHKLASWRKTKTEADKKVVDDLNNKIVHVQAAVSPKEHNDGMNRLLVEDVALSKDNKTTDHDQTALEGVDKNMQALKSRMKNVEAGIYSINKWQREKLESDKKSQEQIDSRLTDLQQGLDGMASKAGETTDALLDKTDQWNFERPDYARMIARLKRKTDGHEELLRTIEDKVALTTTNMVQVSLNSSQPILQSGKRTRLDKCVKVWFDKQGLFDRQTCCLVPRVSCKMALAWRVCQLGQGELEAWMGVEGVGEGDYLGRTCRENEVMSGVLMWGVRKGQKIWMEVERGEGEAGLWSCLFMAWVVG